MDLQAKPLPYARKYSIQPRDTPIIEEYRDGIPVLTIRDKHGLSLSTLYAILAAHEIPLRGRPSSNLTVVDPDTGDPMEVLKTIETRRLRDTQVRHAYHSTGELVSDILQRFHINTKTLYGIVQANRYSK